MQHASAPLSASSVPSQQTFERLAPLASSGPLAGLAEPVEQDRGFAAMLRALSETGGLMRGDEVADLLVQRGAGDVARLARWIVERKLLSIEWRGELWIPMFQFNLADMGLKDEARRVCAELAPVFDGWALVLWFATPNAWLQDRLPAEALARDFQAVLEAARADRFVAVG